MPKLKHMLNEHRYFLVVALIFLGLAIWYNLATPVGEGDNEVSHYRYIQYIKTYAQLPGNEFSLPDAPSENQCRYTLGIDPDAEERQFRQPPLYYALSAAMFFWLDASDTWWPADNQVGYHAGHRDGGVNTFIHAPNELFSGHRTVFAVHVLRLFSAFLGIAGLIATYLTGQLLLRSRRHVSAAFMAAAVAFTPTYIFSASVINNDILVGALGLWCIYFCLRAVLYDVSLPAFGMAALCLTLAVLTKYTAVFLFIPFGLTLLALMFKLMYRKGGAAWRSLAMIGVVLAFQAAIAGWWFLRNKRLHNDFFAGYQGLDLSTFASYFQSIDLQQKNFISSAANGIKFTFISYWGLLGADAITLPDWLLNVLGIAALLVVLGVIANLLVRGSPKRTKKLIAIGAFILFANWYLFFVTIQYGARGRYMLSLYSIVAFIAIWGANWWRTKRFPRLGVYVYCTLLLGISIAAPFIIQSAYTNPKLETEPTLRTYETPVHAVFGDFAELVGVSVLPSSIGPYEHVDVTLVWRVLEPTANNYVVGMHLEGGGQTYFGGVSHFPGKGNYATSLWKPGDIFRDTYRLIMESGSKAPLPTGGRIKISMICPVEGKDQHLPVASMDGDILGDAVYSVPIRLGLPVAETEPVLDHVLAHFGNEIGLVRVSGAPASLLDSASASLEFEWQALTHPSKDYTVYVHLLNGDDTLIAGQDYPLTQNYYPSSLWLPGEQVLHEHPLDFIPPLPTGDYRLVAGLYDSGSGQRLSLDQDSELASPHGVLLGSWHVESNLMYLPHVILQKASSEPIPGE